MELGLSGQFHTRIKRKDKIIYDEVFSNGIVNVGYNNILDVMFGSVTKPTWYCGLIDSITTLSASDTMSSHSGWTEYTNYDESNRQEWSPDAAASKNIQNSSSNYMEFTINDATSPTLEGIFLADDNAKSGTSGILWCTAQLAPSITVADDDVVQIQYKVTIN